MVCQNCGSTNVLGTNEQTNGKTKTKQRGIIPNMLYKMLRLFCCLMIFGFFMPKTLTKSSTKFKNATVGICQDCGHKFTVHKG